jgi:hypothetical protein
MPRDTSTADGSVPQSGSTRSQERYDRFAAAVDTPMLVITILWLPVLIVPLVTPVHGAVAASLDVLPSTTSPQTRCGWCERRQARAAQGNTQPLFLGSSVTEPGSRRPRSLAGQAGIINQQALLKRRHKPVRQLLAETGEAAQRLKPCFMMSPLSVSHFLPVTLRFDVVIFDEASQVREADAICCVYRGRQLIIAGDPKQLPPTSFWERDQGVVGDSAADLASAPEAHPWPRRMSSHHPSPRQISKYLVRHSAQPVLVVSQLL